MAGVVAVVDEGVAAASETDGAVDVDEVLVVVVVDEASKWVQSVGDAAAYACL